MGIAVSSLGPVPDAELLSRFVQRRDEEAFAELVRRHGPVVRAACRRTLGETPDADSRYGGGMGHRGSAQMAAMAAHSLSDRNLDIAETVRAVADELGATPSAVATAWCLARRGVTSVIVGPRTLEQLQAYLPAFALTLPEAATKRLSDVSRPGGARTGAP